MGRKKDIKTIKKLVEDLISEILLIPKELLFDTTYEVVFSVEGKAERLREIKLTRSNLRKVRQGFRVISC